MLCPAWDPMLNSMERQQGAPGISTKMSGCGRPTSSRYWAPHGRKINLCGWKPI